MLITIGAILGIVGWVQIKHLGHVRRILMGHMVIGLILFGFVLIQVSAALARPTHKSNLRCSCLLQSQDPATAITLFSTARQL